MNYLEVIRVLFKSRPSLEEFIDAHNVTDTITVERLTQQYNRLVESSAFYS